MNEKDVVIINAIEKLTEAVNDVLARVVYTEAFLTDHFNRFHKPYTPNPYSKLEDVKNQLEYLKRIAATNADNKHLLSAEQEVAEPQSTKRKRGYNMSESLAMFVSNSDDIIQPPAKPYSRSTYDRMYDPDLDF